jgi:N-acyl-D-aspartate/D-glutamate deacylase
MARRLAIRGGLVHDGTGAEPVAADVLVDSGRITAVGALGGVDAEALDATGCVVAPGFVDVHSHSDYTLLVDPRAVSSIHQGVTTEVIGNCGFGCFPIVDPQAAAAGIYGYRDDHRVDWRTAAEYLERLEAAAPAVNVATLVPNGQLRRTAMAQPSEVARPDEVAGMARLLAEALDAGAWGYSTGLEYAVEERADEREVAELCRVAARVDALYATHTRARGGDGVDGVAEALRTYACRSPTCCRVAAQRAANAASRPSTRRSRRGRTSCSTSTRARTGSPTCSPRCHRARWTAVPPRWRAGWAIPPSGR